MNNTEKLKQLYQQASQFDEALPAHIMQKLVVYGKILELLGGFHAAAVKEWKLKESYRREAIASAFTYNVDGTAAERTNQAEVAAAKARKEEAEAEGEALRWKNAYDSVKEQIQILKLQLKDMKEVDAGGV